MVQSWDEWVASLPKRLAWPRNGSFEVMIAPKKLEFTTNKSAILAPKN
jgi:hypothetical protein